MQRQIISFTSCMEVIIFAFWKFSKDEYLSLLHTAWNESLCCHKLHELESLSLSQAVWMFSSFPFKSYVIVFPFPFQKLHEVVFTVWTPVKYRIDEFQMRSTDVWCANYCLALNLNEIGGLIAWSSMSPSTLCDDSLSRTVSQEAQLWYNLLFSNSFWHNTFGMYKAYGMLLLSCWCGIIYVLKYKFILSCFVFRIVSLEKNWYIKMCCFFVTCDNPHSIPFECTCLYDLRKNDFLW